MGINILDYDNFLNEMSISDDDIKLNINMLKDIKQVKNNIKKLNSIIIELRSILSNQDSIKLSKPKKENNKIYFHIKYVDRAYYLIGKIESYLQKEISEDILSKYHNIIFPDDNEITFNVEIELEINNLNRIHIPNGLPFILKNIGFGKQIYRKIIKEFGFISTLKMDQSLDAIFVWDSLRKDTDIYSFLREQQMLCIDDSLVYINIEELLLNFFKYEIENEKNKIKIKNYILDSDFKLKYMKNIMNSDLKFIS